MSIEHYLAFVTLSFATLAYLVFRNEEWLTGVVEAGAREGVVQLDGTAREFARLLTGALEGSMLLAYSYGDTSRFVESAERLLGRLLAPR